MREVAFAVPGDLDSPTGGYAYARRLLALLPDHGIAVRHLPLPGGFPHPGAADLAETERALRSVQSETALLVDGLAYGALPADLIAQVAAPVVVLVHHPLAHETGISPARRAELHASERDALARAGRVIAASAATARLLATEYGVPVDRIAVAEPGTEPAPRARGTGDPPQILGVGAVTPRKGFDLLVDALAGLADLPWRLTIAGSLDRDPAAVEALRRSVAETGICERVVLAGAVDEAALADLYDRADLFVSPSLFEGYGMVLAEAMARGLPLVASTGGAAAETVPERAALKVPPGDVGALRDALRRLLADPTLRARLAEGSWDAGRRLPRWSDTAAVVAGVLKEVR